MKAMRPLGRRATHVSPFCRPTARTEARLLLQILGASIMMAGSVLAMLIAGTPEVPSDPSHVRP